MEESKKEVREGHQRREWRRMMGNKPKLESIAYSEAKIKSPFFGFISSGNLREEGIR